MQTQLVDGLGTRSGHDVMPGLDPELAERISNRLFSERANRTKFSYDVRGNLLSVTLPSGDVIEYLVDGQDRRVGKKKNGTLQKMWLYRDGLNPVAELDGSGALVSRFVYASRTNVPDFIVRGGVTYRIASDHLGSPRAIVDVASGAIVWRADFDAWGNRTVLGAEDFTPFGFAGGVYDHETGLTRFGARDYDPVIGRWASKDPIPFDKLGARLYVYAGGDPVNRWDPEGRSDREFGNFLQCAGALALCRFTVCMPQNPVAAGACAACIVGALVGPCSKPFGPPDPGHPPPPIECPPGSRPGGWLEEPCVEEPCIGSGCPNACYPPPYK